MLADDSRIDRIDFRPLAADDLPALLYWLGDPDVSPWYDDGALTLENVTARFLPVVDGTEPTRGFTIVIDGQPVGYIQAYAIGDHPDYQRQLDVDPRAVATDLFIGDATYRNRGWGSVVLRADLDPCGPVWLPDRCIGAHVLGVSPGRAVTDADHADAFVGRQVGAGREMDDIQPLGQAVPGCGVALL
jgi:hypothetical protein